MAALLLNPGSRSRFRLRFHPRIQWVFLPIGIAIFGVVLVGSLVSVRHTLKKNEVLGKSHLGSVQTLKEIRQLEALRWSHGGAELDQFIDGLDALRVHDGSIDLDGLVESAKRYRDTADPGSVPVIWNAVSALENSREQRLQGQSETLIGAMDGWIWKLWVLALSGGALIWAIVSLIVLTISGPVAALSRAVDELDLRDLEAEFQRRLTRVHDRYWIIPREILDSWRRVGTLIGRVALAREQDFRALSQQKDRAELIASVLSDGLFTVRDGRVEPQNPIGRQILESVPDTDDRILRVVRDGTDGAIELERSGGSSSFVLSLAGWLEPTRALVVARDVTSQRESERGKNHFLGLLSHEIRTPVTSLVMAIRLLQRASAEFQNPVHQKLIQTSAKDVERLRELLDDLLSISRFESGVGGITRRTADLRRILKSSHESFQVDACDRGVRLESYIQDTVTPDDWSCEVDASKLGWALSNLLLNAIRNTPRGGEVSVELRRSKSFDGRRFLEYRIRDSGPGIAPERLPGLMDPFSGVYDLRVARSDATGSGLSIARQIAESHGGSLRVCSDPGRGCEFQLRLQAKERMQDGKVARSG
jgi:signal transduction histidine kinase